MMTQVESWYITCIGTYKASHEYILGIKEPISQTLYDVRAQILWKHVLLLNEE